MFKQIVFLSIAFITLSLHAMDNNEYYVRFVENLSDQEGELVTFPKSMLNDLHTLKHMQEDLGDDLGSQEKPFLLSISNISRKDFDTIIRFINTVHKIKQRTDTPINSSEELQNELWIQNFQFLPDRYVQIANLIRIGNYIGFDTTVINALKLCITQLKKYIIAPKHKGNKDIIADLLKKIAKLDNQAETIKDLLRFANLNDNLQEKITDLNKVQYRTAKLDNQAKTIENDIRFETLDDALQAGLTNINKLDFDTLLSIKELLLNDMREQIEEKIIDDMNNVQTMHQKIVLEVPERLKDLIYYAKITSPFSVHFNGRYGTGVLLAKETKNIQKEIALEDLPINLPLFTSLGAMPNQHLISSRIHENGINPKTIDLTARPPRVFIDNYYWSFYNKFEQHVEIGVGYILKKEALGKPKWISIPNQVSFAEPFKDNTETEKYVCVVGTEDDDSKIVIIDQSETCSLIKTCTNETLICATVFESKLIYRTQDIISNKNYLEIMDLNNYKILTRIDITTQDDDLFDSIADSSNIFTFIHSMYSTNKKDIIIKFIRIYDRSNSATNLYTITIDRENLQVRSAKHAPTLIDGTYLLPQFIDAFPSKVVFVFKNHPDISNFQYKNIFMFNGELYVGGFDGAGTKNFFIYKYLSKETIAIFDQIKNLSYLSIEQLYALQGIVYRITHGTFKKMTPTEKQLFESMNIKDQNLFLNLFSKDKPITDMKGRPSIINPAKAGAYETPLKGYIEKQAQPHGQKRFAQESPDEERPAKKQKPNPTTQGDEESQSDETTLDESKDK